MLLLVKPQKRYLRLLLKGKVLIYLPSVVAKLIRSPLVSFLYERGWRQNFNRSGFPGPDEEVICFLCELLYGLYVPNIRKSTSRNPS